MMFKFSSLYGTHLNCVINTCRFTCSLLQMAIVEEGIYMPACLNTKWFYLVEEPSIVLNIIPGIEAFTLIKAW